MITLQEAIASSRGEWASFNCPNHSDNSPSARVNTLTRKWVCMVCGSKGVSEKYLPPERLVLRRIKRLSDSDDRDIPESYLDLFDSSGPGEYWSSRFTGEACKRFRLGYDSVKEKPVYPVRNPEGSIVGLVSRGEPGDKPKYRYPRGVSTSMMLFNYEQIRPESLIVVVEGAPDVIALWEAGVQAVGAFGARLYKRQIQLLSRLEPTKVVVAFDQDEAGDIGADRAVRSLGEMGLVSERARWGKYNDVGDMPVSIRRNSVGALDPSSNRL